MFSCLITTLLLFHSEFFGEQFDSSVAFQKLVLLLRVPVHLETVMSLDGLHSVFKAQDCPQHKIKEKFFYLPDMSLLSNTRSVNITHPHPYAPWMLESSFEF